MNDVDRVIIAYSHKLGLDPQAVRGISEHEARRRRYAVGDHGTSFGPFQLHRGGALPAGKGLKWAGSNAGILYAMQQMSKYARGKTGLAAVSAISRQFERPANPSAEIAHAMQFYRGSKVPRNIAPPAGGSIGAVARAIGGGPSSTNRQALIRYAMAQSQALIGQGEEPNIADLMTQMRQEGSFTGIPGHSGRPRPERNIRYGTSQHGHGIAELFYDPLGGIKHNKQIGAIGGHDTHAHFAAENPKAMLMAIAKARSLGLRTSENPYVDPVDPVHVKGSYHYRLFPGKYHGRRLGRAVDVSGARMSDFYKWASSTL